MKQETVVLIVGAGPAGIATSACLNLKNIPNLVLEKDDCCASLWRKRSYDRLKLHLANQFCELPYMSFPPNSPTFVSKKGFLEYLDSYITNFSVNPLYQRAVESAFFNCVDGKWHVKAMNVEKNIIENYVARFLVVATGENGEGFIPKIEGLDGFGGTIMHSSEYGKCKNFEGKDVLVVGCGNSGMEIAYDLSNWGAQTSIIVRSPVSSLLFGLFICHCNQKNLVQIIRHFRIVATDVTLWQQVYPNLVLILIQQQQHIVDLNLKYNEFYVKNHKDRSSLNLDSPLL